MAEEPRLRIDPLEIPDETLARLRKLAVQKVLPLAPRFCGWLVDWIGSEQFARKRDPKHRNALHLLALPPCEDWSNVEIGQTLRAVGFLSMMTLHGSLNDFLDRLVLAIGEMAAERLGAKADA